MVLVIFLHTYRFNQPISNKILDTKRQLGMFGRAFYWGPLMITIDCIQKTVSATPLVCQLSLEPNLPVLKGYFWPRKATSECSAVHSQ